MEQKFLLTYGCYRKGIVEYDMHPISEYTITKPEEVEDMIEDIISRSIDHYDSINVKYNEEVMFMLSTGEDNVETVTAFYGYSINHKYTILSQKDREFISIAERIIDVVGPNGLDSRLDTLMNSVKEDITKDIKKSLLIR